MKSDESFTIMRTENYGKIGFDFLDVYDIFSKEFFVRRNSIDITLLETIIRDECYDPNMWFNRNLREEYIFNDVKCIIDVGANIGITTCYFAHLFPDAMVYSFEAESGNYELLCKNTIDYKNVKIHKKAIWNHSSGVYIDNRDKIYGHSGKANPAKYEVGENVIIGEEKIESITLSQILKELDVENIDILKMDIQGAEIEAFDDWEIWLPKVRLLFIETHDLFRRGCSNKVFKSIVQCGGFSFIGSPNGEILVFIKEKELL